MAILTDAEISDRLFKGSSGFEPLNDQDLILGCRAVEGLVKRRIRRNFESQSYTSYFNIDQPSQSKLCLFDWPVSAFTSLSYLESVTDAGVESWTAYHAGDYYADLAHGVVHLRDGYFPIGVKTIKAVYTAGYSSAELAANALDEIVIMKSLLLSIIQREYGLNRDNKRHLRTHGYDGESATYNFDFTYDELGKIKQLKRWD